jgi:hypothetical protein
MFYSIRLRRKTGIWETELEIRQGRPPEPGDEVVEMLEGKMIKARVTLVTKNPRKAKGEPVLEVHAEEV